MLLKRHGHGVGRLGSVLKASLRAQHTLASEPSVVSAKIDPELEEEVECDETGSKYTRGKKLKPKKDHFLVLNPRQSGLLKRKPLPRHFSHQNNEKLRILEGVEIDTEKRQDNFLKKPIFSGSNKILQEIEMQRKRLLIFESSVSEEQVMKSISMQKPSITSMSQKRYDQLVNLLNSAYTSQQLKKYTKKNYNTAHGSATKSKMVAFIINKHWKCTVNHLIQDGDDLITEKIIDISTRNMYLLLLTNNGKILHNLARIGATLAVAVDENKLILRATASIIKYVELALNKILQNVTSRSISIDELVRSHTANGAKLLTYNETDELISLVQRETGCFFEKTLAENSLDSDYIITSLGRKRLDEAVKLLHWAIPYEPQLVEEIKFCGDNTKTHKQYPFPNIETLDWINRTKKWHRTQQVVNFKSTKEQNTDPLLNLSDGVVNNCYTFLKPKEAKQNVVDVRTEFPGIRTISMTLGQLLRANNADGSESHIFEPKVPFMANNLLTLPSFNCLDSRDGQFAMDQHEYYIQLTFKPTLVPNSAGENSNIPVLELWLELDEQDNAIISSARCFVKMEQRRLYLETGKMSHDYRIESEKIVDLTSSYEDKENEWLGDQPGVKEYLTNSSLSFGVNPKFKIPGEMTVVLPIVNSNNETEMVEVTYRQINTVYHRVLKLSYRDKYMVQLSDVNSGVRGGRFTQIDFVGDGSELDSIQNFKCFLNDVSNFS